MTVTPDKDKAKAPEPERKPAAKITDEPGAFDTSEAVNVTTTLEEANEAGYLGASFDDGDYTVAGVI